MLVLRTALREMRGAFKHFAFFLVCIALGVGALAGVGSVGARLHEAVMREARSLLAADVSVRTWKPLSAEAERVLADWSARGAVREDTRELVGMASAGGESALVEIKAVGPRYPLYGEIVTEPAGGLALLQEAGGEARLLADESLLVRLDLQPGARVRLGSAEFTVAAVIRRETDRAIGVYSLGPRVMLSAAGLKRAGLVQPGSRVRHRALLRLPAGADAEAVSAELSAALKAERPDVDSYLEAQEWLARSLRNLTDYLGLLSLAALFLGGIGVAMSVQAYMAEKLDTLAVLKVLGFGSGQVAAVYLFQTAAMAVLGCLLGAALAFGVTWSLPGLLQGLLSERLTVEGGLHLPSLARAVGMGLAVALLFSLWPLLGARGVRPSRILRRDVEAAPAARPWVMAAVLIAGLAGLGLFQAGSLRSGGVFLGALAGVSLALAGVSWAAVRLLARLPAPRWWPLRYALAAPGRPGVRARTLLSALGVGVTLLVAAAALESSLSSRLRDNLPKDAPDFFFIDIQPDQEAAFVALLKSHGVAPAMSPVLRTRLESLKGARVDAMDFTGRRDAWQFQREYVITFNAAQPRNNPLVAGTWGEPGGDWVSVEAEAAKRLGLAVGDELVMDVQGRPLKARVANLRAVRWGDYTTNFFMIFSPSLRGDLPVTWLATLKVPREQGRPLQRAVIKTFPNVTAFDLRQVLDTVAAVFGRIAGVVRFMALFTLAAGLAVLAGALASTRYRRRRESAVLKAAGATRGQIAAAFASEYAVLGLTAGVCGAACGLAVAAAVTHWVMKMPLVAPAGLLAAAALGTSVGAVVVGLLTTWGVLGVRPLAVLRSE